jgi:hypothetical protein
MRSAPECIFLLYPRGLPTRLALCFKGDAAAYFGPDLDCWFTQDESARAATIRTMISGIPSFEAEEVAPLVSAVEKTLEHLRAANERVGGNDTELIEYGRRYAVLLQELKAVANT